MKNKTSDLTKSKKILIVFWGLYELISTIITANQGDDYIQTFLTLSLPCIFYWAGVWIWGFGYLYNLVKRPLNYWKNLTKTKRRLFLSLIYELIALIIAGFDRPSFLITFLGFSVLCVAFWFGLWVWSFSSKLKQQKNIYTILNILSIFMFFSYGYTKIEGTISEKIGAGIGAIMILYIFGFCLSCLANIFVKDKETKKKTTILFIFVLGVLYSIGLSSYHTIGLNTTSKREEAKGQLLNIAKKAKYGLSNDDIQEVKSPFIQDGLNSMVNEANVKIPKYMVQSGLEGIITEDNLYLTKTKEGLNQLYIKGKEIIKKIDMLNIASDVDKIYLEIIGKVKEDCLKKYSAHPTACKDFEQGMKNSMLYGSKSFTKVLEQKRNLVHSEFLVIECLHGKKKNCNDLFNKFLLEEATFKENINRAQNEMVQYSIDTISAIKTNR